MKVDMSSGMYYCPGGPNFRPFCSTGHRLQVTADFSYGGGGDNSETNVLNGESGYVQWYVLLHRGSNFRLFRSTGHRFQVTANIF